MAMSTDKPTQQFIHSSFSGPLPGESWTKELGNAPYEKPPKFVKLSDAMNYLMDRMTEPQHLKQLLSLMSAGLPLEAITRTFLFTGFTTGLWTPDLMALLYKPLMLSLMAIAKRAGIDDAPIVLPSSLDNHINQQTQQHMLMNKFRGELTQPEHVPDAVEGTTEEAPASSGFMERPS